VVVPYFTCDEDDWSVVHVITADVPVMELDFTAEITGAAAAVVVNV
jgi:hypothetical protein